MGLSKVVVGCEWQRQRLWPPLASVALEGKWWTMGSWGLLGFLWWCVGG